MPPPEGRRQTGKEDAMGNLRVRQSDPREQPITTAWGQTMMDPLRMIQRMLGADPFAFWVSPTSESFVPEIEIKETQDSYVICADLPGVRDEDLEVSVTGNRLSVSGKREQETRREDDRYFAYERSYGSFSRSFTLPEGADLDSLSADLASGVLTITVPKKAEQKPRKVEISGKRGEAKELREREPGEQKGQPPAKKAA
jgi:HSP20 family protein